MNHIYKVIWNTITQTWVAVSELSRAKGKTKSSKTLSAVVLAAVSAGAIIGDAEAAALTGDGNGIAIQSQKNSSNGAFARADNVTSTAIGYLVVAESDHALAIGSQTQAIGEKTVAIGHLSKATGSESTALGVKAEAKGNGDIALGKHAVAQGGANGITGSAALGDEAKATGAQSAAVGGKSNASGSHAVASGYNTQATGGSSSAIGDAAEASGNQSTAVGVSSEAKGDQSAALGMQAHAHGSGSIAAGVASQATQEGTTAIGGWTEATAQKATAVGNSAHANANQATALGHNTQATGEFSTATGVSSRASGSASVATGKNATASAQSTIAVGDNAQASGANATSIGAGAIAKNESTIAIGNGAKVGATNGNVAANNGIAIGTESESKNEQAIAVGKKAIAAGNNSIALGNASTTTGGEGVAIGNTANASHHSVAFGSQAKATATDGYSSAFGNESEANKADSSALGNTAKALAKNATSVGAHSKVTEAAENGSALGRSANVSATNGTALGSLSSVTAENGTAVGTSATVTTAGGVALGQGSSSSRTALNKNKVKITAGHVEDSEGISQNDDNNNKNGDVYAPVKLIDRAEVLERVKNTILGNAGAVSLGKDGETTRQLTNLAPGSKDSDAVNVAQLKAVVGTIKHYNVTSKDGDITINPDTTDPNKTVWDLKINPKYKIKYFSVKSEGGANENNDGATGVDAIAIGKDTTALRANAIAIGHEAKAQGYQNDIAIGYKAATNSEKSVAIGDNAKTDAGYSIALGTNATATVKNGIALGSESKASINNGQTGFDASQDADGARVNKYTNLTNNNQNVRTSTLAGLSIGDAAKTRQINHLAAGTADDDAVNVAQLKSVNLAFKGDNGSGDVRLHDQRLSVVGAKDSFITTTASDKKLEISTKQGSFSTTTDGTSSSTTAGLATTTAVASAINNSGWEVQAKGTKVGLVNPGDKVNFTNADKSIEIESDVEASGLSTIKFKAVTETIQTEEKSPITQIDVNGSTVSKTTKGENKPTGRFVVPTGDKANKYALATAYDVADKVNQTGWNLYTNGGARSLINPGDYVNFKSGNATNAKVVTEASEGVTISYDVNVDNTTIKIDSDGNKLTANTGDVDSVTSTEGNSKKGQVVIHKNPLEPSKTDSGKLATVDTVVKAVNNATWYAKAGNDKDVEVSEDDTKADETANQSAAMKAGETLGLKAGKNLRVKRDGTDFTFALNKAVDLTKDGSLTIGNTTVTDGGVTITAKEAGKTDVTLTANGLDNGGNKITHVAKGTDDTDAVNVKQLNESISTETVRKADVTNGDNNIVEVDPTAETGKGTKGATYNISVKESAVKNIAKTAVKVVDGKNTTVTAKDDTSDNSKTYAVNVKGDLTDITSITNTTGNGKVEFTSDGVVNITDGNTTGNHPIKLDGKTGDITGLTNTTLGGENFAKSGRAATEEQLDIVNKKFDNKVFLGGNTGETTKKALSTPNGIKFNVKAADGNKVVTTEATGDDVNIKFSGEEAAKVIDLKYKSNNDETKAKTVKLSNGLDFTNGTHTTAEVGDNGVVKFNVNTATVTVPPAQPDTFTGKFEAPTTDGVATIKNVVDVVNNSGWKISQGADSRGIVKAGDEVSFVGTGGTTVTVEGASGKRTVTVS